MSEACLIVRVGARFCALPLRHVAETMRAQPIHPVTDGIPCVRGIAIIRGSPLPVVDAAMLLSSEASSTRATRLVSLKTADRRVALACDEVIGVRQIDQFADLPPLLSAANHDIVSAVATLDGELVLVLRSGRLLPPEAWAPMESGADS